MPTISPTSVGLYEQAMTANTEFVVNAVAVGGSVGPAVEVVVHYATAPVYVLAASTPVVVKDTRATMVLAGAPVVVPLAFQEFSLAGPTSQPFRLISSAAAVVSLRLLPDWAISNRAGRAQPQVNSAVGEPTVDVAPEAAASHRVYAGGVALSLFIAKKTEQVASVRFHCRKPAYRTPPAMRVGLYSLNSSTGVLTLIASTASDPSMAAGTDTWVTRPLLAPVQKTAGVTYAVGVLMQHSGSGTNAAVLSGAPDPTTAVLRNGRFASLETNLGTEAGDLPSTISTDGLGSTIDANRLICWLLP